MPRLRKRVGVGEVMVEEKKKEEETVSTEVPSSSSSPATSARTANSKGPVLKTKALESSSENKMEATTPTGVVKKPPAPSQAKMGKGGIQKSFKDRLQWRSTHCVMPPTSTPIRDPRQKFTKEDIETAFGFEIEDEKTEYSTLVSPIAHASPKGINAPVWKIHPLSQRNVECGVPKSRNPRPPAGTSTRTRKSPLKRSNSEEAKGSPRVKVDRRPALVAQVSPKSRPQIPPTPPEAVHDKKTLELEVSTKPIIGDIELPSIIEVTPPVSSSSHSVVPSSSSEPSQTKPIEPAEILVVKEKKKNVENQAPASAVPLRRGRSRKKVDYCEENTEEVEVDGPEPVLKSKPVVTRTRKRRPPSPVTEERKSEEEELVPEPTKRSTRSTRSQKGGGATVPETVPKQKSTVRKKPPSKVTKPEVLEIEADDEKEEHEVHLEAAPLAKRKRAPEEVKSKKKVKSKTTKTTTPTFAPEKRPLLFENVTRQEDQVTGVSPFSQLVCKYKEEEMEEDGEFRVDPRKIVRTYTSRKRAKFSEERDSEADYDFIPKPTTSAALFDEDDFKTKKKSKKVVKTKSKRKKTAEEDLDEETRKWLEQKNKEFEDVAKVKLVIEQSFSD